MIRKIVFSTTILVSFYIQSIATNQPQKVESINKINKPHDWYIEQTDLWKAEIHKKPSNKEAWLNYYMAVRMARITSKQISQESIPTLKEVVEKAASAIPNSFEYNYMAYRSGDPVKDYAFLQKAYEQNPSNNLLNEEFVIYHEYTGDKAEQKVYSQKWLASGDISSSNLAYSYNLLMSVDPNAVLITTGDLDTEPSWVLQQAKDVRRDVSILNIYMLCAKDYRERVFKDLNIPQLSQESLTDSKVEIEKICEHLSKNITQRPLFFTCSLSSITLGGLSKDLYLTGLAYKYSKDRFDNIAALKKNIENGFLLDYLKVNLTNEPSDATIYAMNQNYLPAMLTLYKHYHESGEEAKSTALKDLMNNIAKSAGKEKELSGYLGEIPVKGNFTSSVKIDVKQYEMSPRPIKGNLYARQTETTNAEYDLFLSDLLKAHDFEKLNVCKVLPVNWTDSIPKNFPTKDPKIVFQHTHPSDDNYPVQNISFEAAQAYCDWLTQVCNSNPKKKYKKVIFRLPTAAEWETAARAKEADDAYYPWSTTEQIKYKQDPKSPTNSLGCYLANFNATAVPAPQYKGKSNSPCNSNPAIDGALFPVEVTSYWPNDFELYCTIGNVAEMTIEKGIAKGGSWYHKPEEATIKSVQHYNEPQPWLGFRVFMEIVQQ